MVSANRETGTGRIDHGFNLTDILNFVYRLADIQSKILGGSGSLNKPPGVVRPQEFHSTWIGRAKCEFTVGQIGQLVLRAAWVSMHL